ncbi:MAG: acyl carrier protein [Candidatus Avigastranaerophilus sp.]
MYESVKNKIRQYIIDTAQIQSDDKEFSDEINLYKYGYLDSIDSMSVIYFLESEFDVKITKEDILLNNLETINNIAKMVTDKIENR